MSMNTKFIKLTKFQLLVMIDDFRKGSSFVNIPFKLFLKVKVILSKNGVEIS